MVRLYGFISILSITKLGKGDDHLATIEAIHSAYRTLSAQNPSMDNLLFYYNHFYELIQKEYAENPEKKFTKRMRKDYIQS